MSRPRGSFSADVDASLSKEVFDTNRGLWLMTDDNQLYPNPHSYAMEGGSCTVDGGMKTAHD